MRRFFSGLVVLACMLSCQAWSAETDVLLGPERYPAFPDAAWIPTKPVLPPTFAAAFPQAIVTPEKDTPVALSVKTGAEGYKSRTVLLSRALCVRMGPERSALRVRIFAFVYGPESAGASLAGNSGKETFDAASVTFAPDAESSFRSEFGVARTRAARRAYGQYQYRFIVGETLWMLATDAGSDAEAKSFLRGLAAAIAASVKSW